MRNVLSLAISPHPPIIIPELGEGQEIDQYWSNKI